MKINLAPGSRRKQFLLLAIEVIVFLIIAAIIGMNYYSVNHASNVKVQGDATYLYIHTGAGFPEILDSLRSLKVLENESSFVKVAEQENYPSNIRSGRYKLTNGMSNKILLRHLLLGLQEPVRLTLSGNIRTNSQLATLLSRYVEPDSSMVQASLDNLLLAEEYGFIPSTIMGMFIPDTYEVYWNISVRGLMNRMKKEYDTFWNTSRRGKANAMNMTQLEVLTLASIVYEESLKKDEMPKIAGVYINRLKKGIPLQADPTLKYSAGDFTIRRVLNKHKQIDSPYNTYRYMGLPPGPICVPSKVAIDAVLNYEHHDFLYFCAKSDFSGYHSFAKTLEQHNQNAREYQKALSRNRIYR
jgi:UPF0755 protein